MTTSDDYAQRDCPACGGSSRHAVVSSDRRAQDLMLDELRPHWSGLFKEKVFFSYERCRGCGLLFAPTYFTAPQLRDLYSDMAPNMDVVPIDALRATQRSYLDTVKSGPLDGHYLEIGPDVGFLTHHAAEEGAFEYFWLFEPNRTVHPELAAAVGGRPHKIIADMHDLSMVPDSSVGLAVMVHVLDHVLDPLATLNEIRRKLKPAGRLLAVTHNEHSALRWLMGHQWPPFCLQHPELYNPKSMKRLTQRAHYTSTTVIRSKNYFPVDFMVRQAAWRFGIDLRTVPLPKATLGLRLGNMITIAAR